MRGVLALELRADSAQTPRAALEQTHAGQLATLIGQDLAAVAPQAISLDLVVAAAHFDPAEALRPGWPLHRRLQELLQRAPRAVEPAPRVIAFGSDSAGQVPKPLQADQDLQGGRLRVLPFLLTGAADAVDAVGDLFEQQLLDRGMAGPQTALLAQDNFGAAIEHARYLTLFDLMAMTALQYANQGLEPLWPVLETALLTPQAAFELNRPPEPLVRFEAAIAHLTLPSAAAWRARCGAAYGEDPHRLEQGYAMHQARLRQFSAVLQAHAVRAVFDYAHI